MRLYDKVIRICGTTDFMKGLNYQANKVKLTKIEDEDGIREAYFSYQMENDFGIATFMALNLYLDFINLFLAFIRIFARD